jgi:hypothetical protein
MALWGWLSYHGSPVEVALIDGGAAVVLLSLLWCCVALLVVRQARCGTVSHAPMVHPETCPRRVCCHQRECGDESECVSTCAGGERMVLSSSVALMPCAREGFQRPG